MGVYGMIHKFLWQMPFHSLSFPYNPLVRTSTLSDSFLICILHPLNKSILYVVVYPLVNASFFAKAPRAITTSIIKGRASASS